MSGSKGKEFWLKRWQDNDIAWHQAQIEPFLPKYFNKKGAKVFVPLCGKSRDMLWFSEQGCDVLGVELSSSACHQFFKEAGLFYQVEKGEGFEIFSSDKIKILCGDIFDLSPTMFLGIDFVYDRAALIALPPKLRAPYSLLITEICKQTSAEVLLVGREDFLKRDGPPYDVSKEEVERLYGKELCIEVLEVAERVSSRDIHLKVLEAAYRLTPKGLKSVQDL